MGDTFNSMILNPWVGVRFMLKVQGIRDVFLDGPLLEKQNGANWAAETSKSHSYVYRPHMLDVSSTGLRDIGQQITRAQGYTSPGQMSISLMDDRANYLLKLFSRDHEDTKKAVIDADLAHDTTGAGSVITTSETISGWDASGFAYIGRETIYYPSISGADFGTGGGKCTRDVFSIGDCDLSYTINANSNQAPRIISNTPTVWHGRYIQLYAILVDREGRTIGDDLTTMSREIFRGIIQGPPLPDDSYSRFTINARSIDSVLHTSVGLEPVEAQLVNIIGPVTHSSEAQAYDFGGVGNIPNWYLFTESTNKLHITLTSHTFSHEYEIELFSSGTIANAYWIQAAFNETAQAAIQAQAAKGFDDVTVDLQFKSKLGKKLKGVWLLNFDSSNANHTTSGHADEILVTIDWDADGSIGSLMGMSGVRTEPMKNTVMFYSKWDTYPVCIIGPYDDIIPFFYKGNFGLFGQDPPSSGFVRMGEEIIKYTGIGTADVDEVEGMHALTGCIRGFDGTKAQEHIIAYNAAGEVLGEKTDIKFINYFGAPTANDAAGGVSFLDVILQLATSTGSGHHGDYDTLDEYVGPAIPPGHFDLPSFEGIKDAFLKDEHFIRYWFDKPVKLMDLASKWLQPLGLFLTAKVNPSGDYKIAVVESLPPMAAEYQQALTQSNIDAQSPATWQGADQIINEVVVKYNWDPMKGSNTNDYVCVRDTDSITDYGVKGRIEWALQGFQYSYTNAIKRAHQWASTAFARYGRPYDMIEITVDRVGWLINVGDVLLVSMAGPPNIDDGTRVYTTRAVRVMGVSYKYHDPGGQPGATLVVIVENVQRNASYSPSAAINSAASAVMTLKANEYTMAGISTDVDHFDVGDYVTIFNRGDDDNVDERNIVSISGNNVTLNSALSNVTHNAATTIMVASKWDNANVTATQRSHVYLSTLTSTGGHDTTPFKYI